MAVERVSSLDKALNVLLTLRDDGTSAHAVGDIARATNLDKAQVSRYLQTFSRYGLVERLPGRQGYRLGWGIVALSQQAFMSRVLTMVGSHIRALCRSLEESVFFSVREGDHAVTLTSAEPERRLYSRSWNGRPFSLVGSGVGYVLLAECRDEEVRQIWEADSGSHSWERVRSGVDQAREQGFVIVRDEFSEGISAAAFPLRFERNGQATLVGALSVSAPSERFERHCDAIVSELRDAAARLRTAISADPT